MPLPHAPAGVAWGDNDTGALGDGTTDSSSTPLSVQADSMLDFTQVSAIDSGETHTCAIAKSADLYCWGGNEAGQLGLGDVLNNHLLPTRVQGGVLGWHSVVAVSAGNTHTCVVADRVAYCWGDNTWGQLGDGTTKDSKIPVRVTSDLKGQTVTAISAGAGHTCAIAGGRAYCWGADNYGQLGDGLGQNQHDTPIAVNTLSGLGNQVVDSITAGADHTCATAGGKAYCWGKNDHGQLGDNSLDTSTVPIAVDQSPHVLSIAAGGNSTCDIVREGVTPVASCWGTGAGGILGNGSAQDQHSPTPVHSNGSFTNTKASAISMSRNGGCALEQNRSYCWGNGGTGRLGAGVNKLSSNVPIPVTTSGVLAGHVVLSVSAEALRTTGIAATTPTFTDVGPTNPFRSEITWLAGSGTAHGYDDGTYRPGTPIDRQAMAAFLYRYLNPNTVDPVCDPQKTRVYTDVHTLDQFCGPIEWLANVGINPAGGKFHPLDPTRRDTMASWLFHTHHPNTTKPTCVGMTRLFSDVPATDQNCGYIEWLAEAGITTGFADGKYQPGASVARQSMAAFLRRLNALTSH